MFEARIPLKLRPKVTEGHRRSELLFWKASDGVRCPMASSVFWSEVPRTARNGSAARGTEGRHDRSSAGRIQTETGR